MARDVPYMLLPDDDFLSGVARRYDQHTIRPGDLVGNLRVDSVLGRQGNVSTVFRARALSDLPAKSIQKGLAYIVKGIPLRESSSHATNTRNLRSFFNEMRILPHIRNPARNNIVEMVDWNDDPTQGKLYMAFKEIAYQAVREKYPNKQLEPTIVLHIAQGLNRALAHLHGLGIAHGDVKPENFMIDFGSVPKLVDFGSAFFYGRKGKGGRVFPSDPAGYREAFTPLYTPPEVAKAKLYELDQNPKNDRADAWALGLTLAELLTGERPYYWLEDFSLQHILETIGRGVPPVRDEDLSALADRAPSQPLRDTYRFLHTLVQRFLEPSVEKRLTCGDAFGEILQFADKAGVHRPPPAPKEKIRDKVEMARRLAQLEGDDDEGGTARRRRRRQTAQIELQAYEMRQAYLKSKTRPKTTIQKGWTPGFEKVEPPAEEEEKPGKKFQSFEEFVREKKPDRDRKDDLSFEEFREKREAESLERMKDLFSGLEGGDTRDSATRGGTRGGTRQGRGAPAPDKTAPLHRRPPAQDTSGLETVNESASSGRDAPPPAEDTVKLPIRDDLRKRLHRSRQERGASPPGRQEKQGDPPGPSGDETLPGPFGDPPAVDRDAVTAAFPVRKDPPRPSGDETLPGPFGDTPAVDPDAVTDEFPVRKGRHGPSGDETLPGPDAGEEEEDASADETVTDPLPRRRKRRSRPRGEDEKED